MSRKDLRLEGYEPGNGYQPAGGGASLRGFLIALLAVAAYFAATELLKEYLGQGAVPATLRLLMGACFLALGANQVLNAERLEEMETDKDVRRARFWGLVLVIAGTGVVALSIRTLLSLVE